MKITKYPKGFNDEGHTPYRLELQAENGEEMRLVKELNKNYVVWVSPHEGKGIMCWWGKK